MCLVLRISAYIQRFFLSVASNINNFSGRRNYQLRNITVIHPEGNSTRLQFINELLYTVGGYFKGLTLPVKNHSFRHCTKQLPFMFNDQKQLSPSVTPGSIGNFSEPKKRQQEKLTSYLVPHVNFN